MNPEKRRSTGPLRAHRTSPSSHAHANAHAHASSSSAAAAKDMSLDKDGLPTLPPRAAVLSSTVEEPHDGGGGASLSDKDTTSSGKENLERSASTRSSSATTAAAAVGRKEGSPRRTSGSMKQKDRAARDGMIKERDDKIANLERELAVMEMEFTKELDKLSQNESETATFWQGKHSTLNQQFLRTDTELRLLRSEVEVREAEREELRSGWEVLRRELKERDEEIRGLRGQVRGLKEWVSTSTRTDGQTSDEVFGDGMARLGNGLQNWVIVNFRKAKMDLSKVDEETLAELSSLVPMYEDLARTSKVYLLQSLVSSILVEMVFDAYYVGLSPEQTEQFRKMEELLSSFTGADEPVNQWRSSTLALIRREAPVRLSDSTSTFTTTVLTRVNRLLDSITTSPNPPPSSSATSANSTAETRDSGLRVLINNSIELARLLAVQKAMLKVFFPQILPHQRVPFEPDTMEDIGGEDEDSLLAGGREICCVAFPGVIKHGDESGGHLQFRNVITKARVLCSPEED